MLSREIMGLLKISKSGRDVIKTTISFRSIARLSPTIIGRMEHASRIAGTMNADPTNRIPGPSRCAGAPIPAIHTLAYVCKPLVSTR